MLKSGEGDAAVTNCNYLECRQISLNFNTMEMTYGFLMVFYAHNSWRFDGDREFGSNSLYKFTGRDENLVYNNCAD